MYAQSVQYVVRFSSVYPFNPYIQSAEVSVLLHGSRHDIKNIYQLRYVFIRYLFTWVLGIYKEPLFSKIYKANFYFSSEAVMDQKIVT